MTKQCTSCGTDKVNGRCPVCSVDDVGGFVCQQCGRTPAKRIHKTHQKLVLCQRCYEAKFYPDAKVLTQEYLDRCFPIGPEVREQVRLYNKVRREYAIETADWIRWG